MTLQSLSHSSNGSLRESCPFGESRKVTRELTRVRPLAALPLTRVFFGGSLCLPSGELASRLLKRGLTKVVVVAYESGRKVSFDCIKIF